jgi:cytochrome c oxidase subunit 4
MTDPHPPTVAHAGPSGRFYVAIWGTLVLLTGLTVGVTYFDLRKLAVLAAILIATIKATLVALYFMHLRYESRLFTTVLLVGLGSFAIFIALTFTDLSYRFH